MYKSKKMGCHPPQIPLKVGLGAPILDAPTLEVKLRILFFHACCSNVLACPVHHFFTSAIAVFMAPLHGASLGGASSAVLHFFIALHSAVLHFIFFIALHSAVLLLQWTRWWWEGGWSRKQGLLLRPLMPGKVLQDSCEWF
jgi:hypothetical protein